MPEITGSDRTTSNLPTHIETTVRAIADMHTRHQQRASPSQRAFSFMAKMVARPRFIGFLTVALAVWIAANLSAATLGLRAWDPPPFVWLQAIVSIAVLYTTAVILIAQKREDELAALREQLTLELAILGEQKSAKTIELLETLRRDLPSVPDRFDAEAGEMAQAADPLTVADAILEKSGATVVAAVKDDLGPSPSEAEPKPPDGKWD
jgi:uncharacterized membrane protein